MLLLFGFLLQSHIAAAPFLNTLLLLFRPRHAACSDSLTAPL